MKRLASAISLMIASTLATAADPQVRVDESLVLAYNNANAKPAEAGAEETLVSRELSNQVMLNTLGKVSASLGHELDQRIAELMTAKSE